MFYDSLIFQNTNLQSNYDIEYLPSIFIGKIIDNEELI